MDPYRSASDRSELARLPTIRNLTPSSAKYDDMFLKSTLFLGNSMHFHPCYAEVPQNGELLRRREPAPLGSVEACRFGLCEFSQSHL